MITPTLTIPGPGAAASAATPGLPGSPAFAPSAQQARHAAEQMVASSFLKPLLAEMRSEALRSDMFHGGLAEDMFQDQLDTILADRIVQSSRLPIVETLYESVMKQAGARQSGAAAVQGSRVDIHG